MAYACSDIVSVRSGFFSAWLASFFFIFSCFGSLGRARCLLSSAEPPLVRSAAFWVNLLALLARFMIELFVYSPKSCFNVPGLFHLKNVYQRSKIKFPTAEWCWDTMISMRALPPPHCTRKNQITQNLHSWTQRVKMTFLLILISLDCWFFIWWDIFFWSSIVCYWAAANAGMIGLPLEVSSSSPDNEDCVNERSQYGTQFLTLILSKPHIDENAGNLRCDELK